MRWSVGLLLVVLFGQAMAEESAVPEAALPISAYDQAIQRFNAHIKRFASWDAFKTEVFSLLPAGSSGQCYALSGRGVDEVAMTEVMFHPAPGNDWHRTTGYGWRQVRPDRTFIEYRLNTKARMLLRAEGVKPRFFFASTRTICEFPLPAPASTQQKR